MMVLVTIFYRAHRFLKATVNLKSLLYLPLLLLFTDNCLYAGKIVLRIHPYIKIPALQTTLVKATLEGFNYKNNQVKLVPTTTLMTNLQTGVIARYPLVYHKKLNYLALDDQLEIVRHDKKNQQPNTITLPKGMNQRILKYLSNDIESDRDCFDFFKAALNVNYYGKHLFFYIEIKEINSEEDLRPGDGIGLFVKNKATISIKHYAIFLGDRLYISKLGIGNCISINNMQSFLTIYQCDHVALLTFTQPTLHAASKIGNYKMVKHLLKRGAKVNAQDEKGQTALHVAADSSRFNIIKLLLQAGATVNLQDESGRSPLHKASYRGNPETVKFLLREGALANLKDNSGQTALYRAVDSGNPEVTDALLDGGADPLTKDNSSWTPLDEAIFYNKFAMVKLLLNAIPNVKKPEKWGKWLLGLAKRYCQDEVITLLENSVNQ